MLMVVMMMILFQIPYSKDYNNNQNSSVLQPDLC